MVAESPPDRARRRSEQRTYPIPVLFAGDRPGWDGREREKLGFLQ